MLFDRGTVAKSKPWNSASSVPLICRGPGIQKNTVVTAPVVTRDLAATFIDYAGGIIPKGMTSKSLRPLLEGHALPPWGSLVESGLDNFRVVIRADNESAIYKLICCNGKCPVSSFIAKISQIQ
jgi:arylsulfatase A-like enzyme